MDKSAWWRHWMPREGRPLESIIEELDEALKQCIDYRSQPILGFPGTTPCEIALGVHHRVAVRQLNNLGYHTKDDPSEMGFLGTQKLERNFIYAVAEMLGVKNPPAEIDGYICGGGTESNDHGLWIARNKLWDDVKIRAPQRRGIVVLRSFLFHYSIEKAFSRLLGRDLAEDEAVRNISRELPTNERGELELRTLAGEIRYFYMIGYRRFAVFLTAGTANMGSIDPVYEICEGLERLQKEYVGIGVRVHVDAAFGGFIVPFIEPDCHFAFQHPLVSSVSIDAHKFGGLPYPAGIFLCRKGLLDSTSTDAWYIYGHTDNTVPGSRSGAIAAAAWASLQSRGWAGFEKTARSCMEVRNYLQERLQAMPGMHVYPSRVNILTIRPPAYLERGLEELWEKYRIVRDHFPGRLTNPGYRGNLVKRDATVYRFTIMPHVMREHINRFFQEWQR
ncbi:MAG: pyridoxal-dependent decarboxylase [Candidatus Jorgensenbacteria bacterium]